MVERAAKSAVETAWPRSFGLILGELLAEEIVTGTPSPVLAPFTLDRFSDEQERDEVCTGAWAPVR